MFNRLKKIFGIQKNEPLPEKEANREIDEKAGQIWYDHKSKLMEEMLGKEHNWVMHAIIPYAVGGGLDLYYYPNGGQGTAIATKELSELPNEGSSNACFSCYELAMFTRHPVNIELDCAQKTKTPFDEALKNINAVLNCIARYSAMAKLNPYETCEFPTEMKSVGGKCVIFDGLGPKKDSTVDSFGILVVIEVFRSEMEYARANGGGALLSLLISKGHYPYSDLDRSPVA